MKQKQEKNLLRVYKHPFNVNPKIKIKILIWFVAPIHLL